MEHASCTHCGAQGLQAATVLGFQKICSPLFYLAAVNVAYFCNQF